MGDTDICVALDHHDFEAWVTWDDWREDDKRYAVLLTVCQEGRRFEPHPAVRVMSFDWVRDYADK